VKGQLGSSDSPPTPFSKAEKKEQRQKDICHDQLEPSASRALEKQQGRD